MVAVIIIIIIIIICSRNVNSSINNINININININNVIVVWGQEVITLILVLSDITLKFWMFLLSVIVAVYKQYLTQDLQMCLLCLHSTFRVGIFSDSLAVDIKLKAKYELCSAAIVLCCIAFCREVTFTTVVQFPSICYADTIAGPYNNCCSRTDAVCAMLLLSAVAN